MKYEKFNKFLPISKIKLKDNKLELRTDTSFNNLSNRDSQAGQIISLKHLEYSCCYIYWNLTKIKKAVKSTRAVETLLLSAACDAHLFIHKFIL